MKLFRKIGYFLICTLSLILFEEVRADKVTFYEGEWIPNIYINKVMSNGYKRYQQGLVIRRKSDNHFAYCLEPFLSLNSSSIYDEHQDNYSAHLVISNAVWQRINLLSYYGYMYEGHEDIKWYAITQVLIWRTVNSNYDIYFTETLNGKRKANAFQSEISEIENLIRNHNKKISFANQKIKANLGTKITLEDSNNVLNNYEITSSTIPATIENNCLNLDANKIGQFQIHLINKDKKYNNNPLIYQSDNSQNIMITGSYADINIDLQIDVSGLAIKVIKKDYDSDDVIKKANLKFKIKNIDTNEYVENSDNPTDKYIFTTNKDGYFITKNNLPYGKYAISEETNNLDGYYWNKEPLIIDLNANTSFSEDTNGELYYEDNFYNKRIKNKIIVHKTGEVVDFINGNINHQFNSLPNVLIGLYAKEPIIDINGNIIYQKNEKIAEEKTDNNGQITFTNLYFGKYYLKEIAVDSKYQLDENKYDVIISQREDDKAIVKSVNIKNYLQKGSLILTKIDSLTNEVISNTKIGLYTKDNELIYEGVTDNNGQIIINNLPLGTYYVKEISPASGYNLNEDIILLNITSNNEIVYIDLKNDPIIEIPDTYNHQHWHFASIISVESLLIILWQVKRKKIIF